MVFYAGCFYKKKLVRETIAFLFVQFFLCFYFPLLFPVQRNNKVNNKAFCKLNIYSTGNNCFSFTILSSEPDFTIFRCIQSHFLCYINVLFYFMLFFFCLKNYNFQNMTAFKRIKHYNETVANQSTLILIYF